MLYSQNQVQNEILWKANPWKYVLEKFGEDESLLRK